MLSIAPPPTIYLHAGATDMRKSFDGLSGIIRGSFGGDPADGSLFLFVNKRRDRLKALCLTMYGQMTAGSWIYIGTQGILQGTFETVASRSGEPRVRIDSTQLAMILGGVRLETAHRRKRYQRVIA